MFDAAEFLIAIGCFLLLGLAADALGRRTFLPRATLLIIIGIVVGEGLLGVVPETLSSRFELITNIALMMIGFLLGGKLSLDSLREDGSKLVAISICAALGATLTVALALVIVGVSIEIAILLGCIAAATAPAATVDTVLEYGGDSRFSRLLVSIVAIDDVWAVILFSLGLSLVSMLNGLQETSASLVAAGYEIFGGMLVGVIVGVPAAFLTGRIKPGQPMLTEALGLVLVCGGVALWFEVSFLIATVTLGAIISNLAKHHEYAFHEIENIEWPFLVIFFLLAGASLDFDLLNDLGLVGVVYLLARAIGKIFGAWLGASASNASTQVQRWMGMALLPQAGVAIGLALLVASRFPEYQDIVLPLVIGTTIVFEVLGPVLTRLALKQAIKTS